MTSDDQQVVDLTNCDREPIHIPGAVQSHGVLMVLSEPDLRILQISTNSDVCLGYAAESLLEQPLATILSAEHYAYLQRVLRQEAIDHNSLYVWSVTFSSMGRIFDGLIHRHNKLLVLELEPTPHEETDTRNFLRMVKIIITDLQNTLSFQEFCDAAAREVRALTGFDRVMIYQFDDDGHGSVIAEALAEGRESFLGLHYPASDIPKQARELYLRNWLRLIADVSYKPAVVVPTLTPTTQQPLDLSYAALRSVSPIHVEYLSNMGVSASMSISLVKNGVLWGLIACHHYSPKYIPYIVRNACEFLAQAVSLQLSTKVDAEHHAHEVRLKSLGAQLVEYMAQSSSWREALLADSPNLLALMNATGLALCIQDAVDTLGVTPDTATIRKLVDWIAAQPDDVYVTNSLAVVNPDMARWKDVASGVLALPITRDTGDYLLWFRPEVIQTVNWSGEPTKAVVASEDGIRLSPRKSFALWQQKVALHALPWQRAEIEAATDLRNAIQHIVLRHASELAQLNDELVRSNIELDAFAYIASHDLKEPLRGLHNFAHFLLQDYQDALDESGQARLQMMIHLTQRMDNLLDSLLHFSRVGRVDLAIEETNLNDLLDEILQRLVITINEQHVQVRLPHRLPTICCDRVRVGEIFYNLISNALKYNTKSDQWIEIGHQPQTDAEMLSGLHTFYVRDNGIGIASRHFDTIFRIFKRLHGQEQFGGGAGAGLTIVKKIVERHGGTIWLESTLDVGTTFFFSLRDLSDEKR